MRRCYLQIHEMASLLPLFPDEVIMLFKIVTSVEGDCDSAKKKKIVGAQDDDKAK